MNSTRTNLSLLLLRLFATPIFLGAGLSHLIAPDRVANRLAAAPHASLALALAEPRILVAASGAALAIGGLALLVGAFTRPAALGLLAVLIPITVTVQVGAPTAGPLLKNVAIAGVLVHLALSGAGAWALDAWASRRRRAAVAMASTALLAFAAVFAPARAVAAPKASAPAPAKGVVMLVQAPAQLDAALETGVGLLRGDGFAAREVRIVACGPALDALVAPAQPPARLDAAQRAGVQVFACGLTLERKKVDASRLRPGVQVVPNGIVEALRLQAQGWLSVEL